MKETIAIVRKYKGYGGIEHQIEMIAEGLKQNDWNVILISDRESPMTEWCIEKEIEFYIVSFENIFLAAYRISAICKEKKVKIIQSHMLWESFMCKLVKLLFPQLKHIFRVHTYIDCSHISVLKKNIYHFVSWITDFLVNSYFPINEYNLIELQTRTHLSKKKIKIIHDMVRIDESEQPMCEFKNGHIGMIANFVEHKGHDVFLEAIKILKNRKHNIVAHFFGGVPGAGTALEDYSILKKVEDEIEKSILKDNIILHGYCTEPETELKDCGILVLPSDSEGTPNVLLEGIMLHKIIVASAVGGVPEFVIDGVTGFLHPPKNPEMLADCIEKVYQTPNMELIQIVNQAVTFVKKEFDRKTIIEQFIAEYRKMIQLKEEIYP